jgi:ABC-type multidrug transport system ATPase subunit
VIEIEALTKDYLELTVVDRVSLTVADGEIAVIVGTSGSGKTTLLRMINRLIEPTSGTVKIDGQDTRAVPAFELRRRIGYAIQGHGLFPHRTVGPEHRHRADAAGLGQGQRSRRGSMNCWSCSSCRRPSSATACRASCRVASSSASAWRGRWRPSRSCC